MTVESGSIASWEASLRAHGPALHRTALMLTGDAERADVLLAAAVGTGREGTAPTPRALEERLVRHHLRTERGRRGDRVVLRDRSGDVGELLQDLPAGLRAAVVLHLAAGWPADGAARAARVRPTRVRELATAVPELGDAMRAVADRLGRPDHEVVRELLETLGPGHGGAADGGGATAYPARGRRSRSRWAAAVTVLGVVAGLALLTGRPDQEPEPDLPATAQTSMAERGWVLEEDGGAPRTTDGLRLAHEATIDYRDPDRPLSLPGTGGNVGHARWAALWCDLPAVDDRHLQVPTMVLRSRDYTVVVPCAGRTGTPALPALTPLPLGGMDDLDVSWTGDLPGRGQATFALYGETDPWSPGLAEGTQAVPDAREGSVVVDEEDLALSWWDGPVHTQLVEIGHDSQIAAWAGSSALIALLVDGVNLTDDGDLGAWERGPDGATWRTQDPQLREGRWFVERPDQTRLFDVPEEVRPLPGQRRAVAVTVAVSVQGSGTDQFGRPVRVPRWQVQVSDASAAPSVGTALIPLQPGRPVGLDDSTAPEFVGGYRLTGHWTVPADGMAHAVTAPSTDLSHLLVAAPSAPTDEPVFSPFSVGVVESASGAAPLTPGAPIQDLVLWAGDPWGHGLSGSTDAPPPPGTARVRLPAAPGHPAVDVAGYLPVPYEEFDFAAGVVLPSSWRDGEPSPYGSPEQGGPRLVDEGEREGGRTTFTRPASVSPVLQVTTQGRGRLRVLLDGEPWRDLASAHDGWWSSWTEAKVTSMVDLGMLPPGRKIVVEVEGWQEGYEVDLVGW